MVPPTVRLVIRHFLLFSWRQEMPPFCYPFISPNYPSDIALSQSESVWPCPLPSSSPSSGLCNLLLVLLLPLFLIIFPAFLLPTPFHGLLPLSSKVAIHLSLKILPTHSKPDFHWVQHFSNFLVTLFQLSSAIPMHILVDFYHLLPQFLLFV